MCNRTAHSPRRYFSSSRSRISTLATPISRFRKRRQDVGCPRRRDAEDAGIHLHARRDAENGCAFPADAADVPRGAVAAAEQDEIDARGEKPTDGCLGILRRGLAGEFVHQLDRFETGGLQRLQPHRAGAGQPANGRWISVSVEQAFELTQRLQGPRIGNRRRTQPCGVLGHVVRALEPDAPTHPGDGVYEKSD